MNNRISIIQKYQLVGKKRHEFKGEQRGYIGGVGGGKGKGEMFN